MDSVPKYSPHYTLADYQHWHGDWELWQGVAVAMSPSPFGRHQWIAGQINRQFLNALEADCNDCFVLMETDWIVSEDTVVRPDVSIVCGDFPERYILLPPRLIVEVLSPSTEEKDRTAKRELYASQSVAFYLLVDPVGKNVQALRLEDTTGCYIDMPYADTLDFELNGDCTARLDLTSLFRV